MIPDVITGYWITSQVFAFFALIAIIMAYQFKKRKWTLSSVMAFNGLMAISSAMLSNWLLVGIFTIGFFRDGAFLLRERYYPNSRVMSHAVLYVFLIGSILVGVFTYRWWFDVPLVFASMFVDYGSWSKGLHRIRISRLTWCSLVIVNHIRFYNVIGIGIEIFVIAAIAVFYIRYYHKKRRGRGIQATPGGGSNNSLDVRQSAEAEVSGTVNPSNSTAAN